MSNAQVAQVILDNLKDFDFFHTRTRIYLMSGCHPQACTDYDQPSSPMCLHLQALEELIKKHWDLNYQAQENLSKLITKVDNAVSQTVDELSREISHLTARFNDTRDCHLAFDISKLEERIIAIEQDMNHSPSFCYVDSKIKEEIDKIMEIFNCNLAADQSRKSVKPHVCPLCNGAGKDTNRLVMDVVKEPSTINMKNPQCIACEGNYIVWG